MKYRVIDKITKNDITDERDWVITPDGKLYYLDYGDLIGYPNAYSSEYTDWVVTENGCVIACPKCGERLELCYPDGTEVRYLPHCPWCGNKFK